LAGAAEGDAEGATVEELVGTALEETGGAMEELAARLDETAATEGLAARVDEELETRLDEELVARMDEELVRLVEELVALVEELVVRLVEELVVRLVEELVVRLVEELAAAGPIAPAPVDVVVLAVEVLDDVRTVEVDTIVTGLNEVIVVVDEVGAAWPALPVTVTTTTTVATSVSVRMRNDVRTACGSARAPVASAEARRIEQRIVDALKEVGLCGKCCSVWDLEPPLQ
jgi:hypothetical protein